MTINIAMVKLHFYEGKHAVNAVSVSVFNTKVFPLIMTT